MKACAKTYTAIVEMLLSHPSIDISLENEVSKANIIFLSSKSCCSDCSDVVVLHKKAIFYTRTYPDSYFLCRMARQLWN